MILSNRHIRFISRGRINTVLTFPATISIPANIATTFSRLLFAFPTNGIAKISAIHYRGIIGTGSSCCYIRRCSNVIRTDSKIERENGKKPFQLINGWKGAYWGNYNHLDRWIETGSFISTQIIRWSIEYSYIIFKAENQRTSFYKKKRRDRPRESQHEEKNPSGIIYLRDHHQQVVGIESGGEFINKKDGRWIDREMDG